MTLSELELEFAGDVTEREDITRCLNALLLTPEGTCPLCRSFGINNTFLGLPILSAENTLAVEIMEKVDAFEPRVTVTQVSFVATTDGRIKAKVVLTNGHNTVGV